MAPAEAARASRWAGVPRPAKISRRMAAFPIRRAGEFGEGVPGKPEVFGGDGVISNDAVAEFPYGGGPVDGDFVDAGAVDDEGSFAP